MFKNILVPTDGSPLSQEAIRRAVSFAKEAGARITFFHAEHGFPPIYFGAGAIIDPHSPKMFQEMVESQAQEILGAAEKLAQEAGVECNKLALTSNVPYEAIIEAANRNDCDLIFMASHGRRGISALLLGSETLKVLAHSSIPVLVHRADK